MLAPGSFKPLQLAVIGQIGGRLVVEVDDVAEIDRRLGHLLVLAELPIGGVQVGEVEAAERLDLAGERLRVVERGGDELVEIDVLDVEGLAHMRAAGAAAGWRPAADRPRSNWVFTASGAVAT